MSKLTEKFNITGPSELWVEAMEARGRAGRPVYPLDAKHLDAWCRWREVNGLGTALWRDRISSGKAVYVPFPEPPDVGLATFHAESLAGLGPKVAERLAV